MKQKKPLEVALQAVGVSRKPDSERRLQKIPEKHPHPPVATTTAESVRSRRLMRRIGDSAGVNGTILPAEDLMSAEYDQMQFRS
jgi:hypothetical protein